MTLTDDESEADVILVNTCAIREKAQDKVFASSAAGTAEEGQTGRCVIGVGGCVASQEGEAIVKRAPYVDLVFGPQTLHRLPEMVRRLRAERRPQVDISFPEIEKFDACRSRAPRARRRSCRSWKAAASTAPSAWCRTRAARKSAGRSTT